MFVDFSLWSLDLFFNSLFLLLLQCMLRTVAFIGKNATVCHAYCMKLLPSAFRRGLSGVVASAQKQRAEGM